MRRVRDEALLRRRLRSCEECTVQPIQRSITRCELPLDAVLRKYVVEGAYTDCFATEIVTNVPFAAYVEAFYTSAAFKLERLVLWLVGKPSSDADARRLARGEAESFAAWSVEARAPDQFLLCDFLSRTRSWLMIAPIDGGGARLCAAFAYVRKRSPLPSWIARVASLATSFATRERAAPNKTRE